MALRMFIEKAVLIFLLHNFLYTHVYSWNNDELEVFDAVDDVKQNFYTLLNVTQDANLNAIKKSFRKLSLALHPDKNPSPTADQDFRHIVTAYEILKSSEKRQYYDKFLEHGMPDWRQAVYYYRRVRKMGLLEMCLILTVIISIGQYLVAWASYIEQKYTLKELLKSKDKKVKKMKKGKSDTISFSDEFIESNVKKPSVLNTLPFQICYITKALVIFLFKLVISTIKDWNKESTVKMPKEQTRQRTEPYSKSSHEKPKKVDFTPELVSYEPEIQRTTNKKTDEVIAKSSPVIVGGLWTDDDILDLIKLVKKYPAGESERWQKIADAMNRTVSEVTHMANKIKDNDFRLPTENEEENVEPEPKKVKTRGGKLGIVDVEGEEENKQSSNWTQIQQKAFETALNKYSKKTIDDRWEKIANCVPGKTKEECMLRYKKIASMVRQRKTVEEAQENS
ncbi:dnaJ homolog subfamily C member 1 [Planococcus citri]|uniref:dnaJ homolog subfamily C member 1 n=1 Tax=Planococcus citri TaxID=170843 RepID=UPI0031FA0363